MAGRASEMEVGRLEGTGALVVASAAGSGFGGALALGSWRSENLLEHVIGVVAASGVGDITVVLGPRAYDIVDSVDLGAATIVIDPEWEEGRASALRAGLDTMWRKAELETALVVDLEHPGIEATTVGAILDRHRSGSRPVTLPKYRYARGGPLVVARELWPHLMGLEGDVDLVALVDAHKSWVTEVWIDRLPPTRVQTPDDLEAQTGR